MDMDEPAVFVLTGIQAAGKSTVAQALAERFPRSVHVHGDVYRRWIVGGAEQLTPDATDEAHRQLDLRHRLTAQACDSYWSDGFTVFAQDVILGAHLPLMTTRIAARPLYVVVLDPSPAAVAAREQGRGKVAYETWAIEQLAEGLHEQTPRIGLWLDTSELTVDETVRAILEQAVPYQGGGA